MEVTCAVTQEQWDLFVWMVDNCEKKQGNACKGCLLLETCLELYQNVSKMCISNKTDFETEKRTRRVSVGNPFVEGHEADLKDFIPRHIRFTRSEQIKML